MILAKADPFIAENYDKLLVSDAEQKEPGKELRKQMQATIKSILQLSGNQKLQQNNPVGKRCWPYRGSLFQRDRI